MIILCFTAIKISDNNRNGVSASGDEYLTVTVENPTINIQLDRNKNEAGFGAASSRITVKESTQAGYTLSAYVENDGDLISDDTIDKLAGELDSVVCFMGCAYVDTLINNFKDLIIKINEPKEADFEE